jgi:hypothetical protein
LPDFAWPTAPHKRRPKALPGQHVSQHRGRALDLPFVDEQARQQVGSRKQDEVIQFSRRVSLFQKGPRTGRVAFDHQALGQLVWYWLGFAAGRP